MKQTTRILIAFATLAMSTQGCSQSGTQPPATGGRTMTGGTPATGGNPNNGGSASTGGSSVTGGRTMTGGTTTTGGTSTSGGDTATGGTTSVGGNPATGGAAFTGGNVGSTGGTAKTGGAMTTGGSLATGGTTTTGGIVATGGRVAETGGTMKLDAGIPDTGSPDASAAYTCNLVIGNTTTQQWFDGGFLTFPGIVSNRWQLLMVGHHYINLWANASDSGWTTPLASGKACATNSKNPDRVIFFVTYAPPYPTKAVYQGYLTSIANNIKAKYPGVKRIEFTTLIRSPGNVETACSTKSGNEQNIPAAEDQAIAAVAADPAFAGLVFALPPFYVTACSDFQTDKPQYTDPGAANIAKVYGAYYADHP